MSYVSQHTGENLPHNTYLMLIFNSGNNPLHPNQKGCPFPARKGELDPIWERLSNLFRWVTGCTSTMCLRWQLASCQVSRSRSRTSWMKAATTRQLRVWKRGKGKPSKQRRTRVLEERSREQCWKKTGNKYDGVPSRVSTEHLYLKNESLRMEASQSFAMTAASRDR